MMWLWAGLGGFIGASGRYLVSTAAQRFGGSLVGSAAPSVTGTLIVNLIGCLAIGLVAGLVEQKGLTDERLKVFLMVGVLGGFTTFSALGLEGHQLWRSGSIFYTVGLFAGQAVIGIGLVGIGWSFARSLLHGEGN